MRLDAVYPQLSAVQRFERRGEVTSVVGLTVEALGPVVELGDLVTLETPRGSVPAEVVGFRQDHNILMPLGVLAGLRAGTPVVATGRRLGIVAGSGLFGRVIGGLGRPMDGKGPIPPGVEVPLVGGGIDPIRRTPVSEVLPVGVRAIDGFLTVGVGQRMGIFAGSGVGKSTLLGMIARYAAADCVVVGLVGERGREVNEFLARDLGPAIDRSVVVVATSDQPALVRVRAAQTAAALAEHFGQRGMRVLLLLDSLTRYAMALREVGLAVGEPPTSRSYTPSVFAELPRLIERAGPMEGAGSVSAFYTVLLDGDDPNDPLADAVRSLVDGHIMLSRRLASAEHYPPIDVVASISRIRGHVVDGELKRASDRLLGLMAEYEQARDMIQLGIYQEGSHPQVDQAIRMKALWDGFLRQEVDEAESFEATRARVLTLVAHLQEAG